MSEKIEMWHEAWENIETNEEDELNLKLVPQRSNSASDDLKLTKKI